jgi:hypothetical protein
MKKSELKNIIKECVKEVLFEEGVLSNLVAEVAAGITKAQSQFLTESKPAANSQLLKEKRQASEKEKRKRLLETKKKMLLREPSRFQMLEALIPTRQCREEIRLTPELIYQVCLD